MKLLLDQNLSFKLARALSDLFPDSAHVRDFHLEEADDPVVWDFAKANGFAVLSKDSDFRQLSFVRGAPPKVIWLDIGNCSTKEIEDVVRHYAIRIIAFDRDPSASFLVLQTP